MADYTFGVGDELQFTTQDGDLIHTWDFGDSTTSTVPNPSHTYNTQGTYTITHIAKDFCDTCIDIGSHTVEIAEASITVRSLLLDKYSINVGDTVIATIIVQNTSLVYGIGTITLRFAGQVVDTRNVSLNPGEVTSYTVAHQEITSGTIDVCADNVCTMLFVESMISVVSITPNPSISTGNAINATIVVKNNGTVTEEKQIQTTLTNQVTMVVDSRLITLAAGEIQTYTVPIDVRALPNGVYTLCADGKCKPISIAIPAGAGTLDITTVPQGAEVFIDGEDKGVQTNTIITDVPSGDRSFKLTLQGYNDAIGITTITSGTTSYIYMSLSPLETTTGSVSISSIPTNADIYIDGAQQLDINGFALKTPATISGLSPVTHGVTLKLSGYLDYNVPVDIVAGMTRYINAILLQAPKLTGDISITSNPAGAEIWIDGNNMGKITPDTIIDASIGLHNFTLKLAGYNDTIGNINVIGGVTSYVFAILVPLSPTKGAISISSIPQNADIYINDVLQTAETPTTISNLDPGQYTIKLRKSGYMDFITPTPIDVIAGQTSYLGVTLSTIQVMEAGFPWWMVISLGIGLYITKAKEIEQRELKEKAERIAFL